VKRKTVEGIERPNGTAQRALKVLSFVMVVSVFYGREEKIQNIVEPMAWCQWE
jgi:hypothetical protein